jgi:DNA-binding SARP family transcriptional activator
MRYARAGYVLLLLFFLSHDGLTQSDRGLLFRSYESPIAARTSLHLSPDEPLVFSKTLQVSFDISFWRSSELGYILRFSSADTGTRVDLLYKPGEGDVTGGFFKLSINGQEQGAVLVVPFDQLVRNNWLRARVTLDKESGALKLTIGPQEADFQSPLLRSIKALNPVFGRSPYGLPSSVATPRFAIRDLELRVDDNRYAWPLQKVAGFDIDSKKGNYSIAVQDPEWIIDGHQRWQSQHTQPAQPIPGIAFDHTKDEIYIVEENLITIYNLVSRTKAELNPKNSFPKDQGTQAAVYSTQQKQLYGYDLGPEYGYRFDKTTRSWENVRQQQAPPIYIWQHAPLENALNGNPMIFAGYGFFEARNKLLEFNPESQKWVEIPLSGDIPEPRFMLGATTGYRKGEYYIYGGYGNASGEQESGFDNLSDLYLLNLNDSSITKLWGRAPGETPFLPSSSMVLHKEDSAIYAIGHDYLDGVKELELLKISINQPKVETIALQEKLPFEIRNIGDYNLFLYYASQTKELVSVLRINTDPDNAEVKIHTISFPPLAPEPVAAETASIPWHLIVPGATLLLGLALIVLRKQKPQQAATPATEARPVTTAQEYAISVMGEFKVIAPDGTNLTAKLSPKLKELFLLILLHTLTDKNGIPTQQLTEILWPDASPSSAKNNRGVNLQKLRQALSPISTVEVSFKENRWAILFQSINDCDLYHARIAIQQNDLDALIRIAESGALLPTTSYEWLDAFKVDIHFKLIQYLMSGAEVAKAKRDWAELVNISRSVLNIDPLHDEALHQLLQGLTALKKVGNAKSAYEQFIERYKTLYNEPYPIKFDDILK